MADNKEQGIKLFGTTISFHGRHLIEEEEEERQRRRQRKLQHQEEDDNEDGYNKSADNRRPDKIIPCPRCKSMDTKFCYFNNYNVNQPRHFCKGCQRYWTAGGALRNVPVGAGRRKSKPLGSGRGLGSGFSEGSLYEGSVLQIDRLMDGMMVEEWMHVAADGCLRHGFPVKRPRRSGSVGQPC